jgi:cytochrome c oxidase subunit I+III
VVAHFHYVMVGGATALFGGLYYWFPKITGKMYDEFLGKLHFALYFIGFNLLYFPMFVAWETPRRVFQYDPAFTTWHRLATVGAFILGVSFIVMFYNLFKSLTAGEDAGENPWEFSRTAEWAIPSPPPLENFPGVPSYGSGKLDFLKPSAAIESGSAEAADGGTAESAADGGVAHAGGHDEEHVESHASPWPFALGVSSFILLLGASGVTTGAPAYVGLTVLGLVALGASLLGLTRERFAGPSGPFGESWPFGGVSNMKTGIWVFLASDVVLFGAFIGSFVFMRVAYGWADWHHLIPAEHVVMPGLINTYLLLTSSFAVVLAMVFAKREHYWGVLLSLITTFVLGLGFLVNKALEWLHLFHIHSEAFPTGWNLGSNVASSTFYLTTGLHGLHVIIGLVIAGYMIFRAARGAYLGKDRPIEFFGLYWHFVDIVWLFLFPLFYIL